jgi:hypothetical protein
MSCNDRIITLKIKAEQVNILIVQVYMPKSAYEDDEVEELYNMTEDIFEEDGKGETDTIIMGIGTVWLKINHIETLLDHMDWEGGIREVKRSSTFIKAMDLSSPTHGLRSLRRLYTWKAPGDRSRDYIVVKH